MDFLLSSSYFLSHDLVEQSLAHVYPPLGLLYLSAYLKSANIGQVGVFDATFAKGEREFEQYLQANHPRLVGIQAVITTRTRVHNMLDIAHSMGIPVVIGGPDASACYELYLNWGADYTVIGEGEETSLELFQAIMRQSDIALQDICGLAYKKNGHIFVNGKRQLIKNLDLLPFPDWKAIDIERYLSLWRKKNGYTSLHVLSSRGCPFGCTWCSRAVFGQTVRQRSVENVVAEITALGDLYHPDSIWFADDTFTMNQSWIETFSDTISQRHNIIPFRCFTRADRVTPELAKKLKSAGCRLIHMGVESGSQRVLDAMNKGQKIETIRNATKDIHDAGIEINYYIMFGYPGEKLKDIRATEVLIREGKPESIGFSIAYPVPGTQFYKIVKDSLVSDIDWRWEKATQNVQRMFQTEFPLIYYRNTIQHIQLRMQLECFRGSTYKRLYAWLRYLWLGLTRWLIERLWLSKSAFNSTRVIK